MAPPNRRASSRKARTRRKTNTRRRMKRRYKRSKRKQHKRISRKNLKRITLIGGADSAGGLGKDHETLNLLHVEIGTTSQEDDVTYYNIKWTCNGPCGIINGRIHTVSHRYSDFDALRKQLIDTMDSEEEPHRIKVRSLPFPEKHSLKNKLRTLKAVVSGRQDLLSRFLWELLIQNASTPRAIGTSSHWWCRPARPARPHQRRYGMVGGGGGGRTRTA